MESREHLFHECPVEHLCVGGWVAPIGMRLKINFDASAFAAEAVACLQALQLGLYLGLRKVEIEGDSRTVIRKLQVEYEDRSEIAVFINDSKKLSLGFQTCVFLFTNRDVNKVAHLIASEGIRMRESTYLVNQVFSVTAEMVAEDQRKTESMRELRS